MPDDRLSRYAELVLRVGCNLQPGQELFLEGKVEHVDFVRKLTESAYRLGATYVHVHYTDEHVRHALGHALPLGFRGRLAVQRRELHHDSGRRRTGWRGRPLVGAGPRSRRVR